MTKYFILLFAMVALSSCSDAPETTDQTTIKEENKQAPETGPKAQIDAASMHLVENMEEAMGGRAAYDAIESLEWNFFGARKWWWNKKTGDVRVTSLRDTTELKMNVFSKKGTAMKNGQQVTDATELENYMKKGYGWWINDAYWLVMPFKLRDPGIKLTYKEARDTEEGQLAEVTRLTFDNVGLTPQNAYDLYFDPQSHMLIQWDFYGNEQDTVAAFKMPWKGYETHAGVKFSVDRGQRKINEIAANTSK